MNNMKILIIYVKQQMITAMNQTHISHKNKKIINLSNYLLLKLLSELDHNHHLLYCNNNNKFK